MNEKDYVENLISRMHSMKIFKRDLWIEVLLVKTQETLIQKSVLQISL